MAFLVVLHNSYCGLYKMTGTFLPASMYPRLGRAKNGVFSIASPVGTAAGGRCYGNRCHFEVRSGARRVHLVSRELVCWPKPPAEGANGVKRCFRRVCSRPGLLNTRKNARCLPGDPCTQRKPCSHCHPHRHFAALAFLDAGPE